MFHLCRYLDENYLSSGRKSEGWTLEGGYPVDAEKDTYPRRAMSAGTRAGLVILMRAYQQDLDYICRGPVQGFKVRKYTELFTRSGLLEVYRKTRELIKKFCI